MKKEILEVDKEEDKKEILNIPNNLLGYECVGIEYNQEIARDQVEEYFENKFKEGEENKIFELTEEDKVSFSRV